MYNTKIWFLATSTLYETASLGQESKLAYFEYFYLQSELRIQGIKFLFIK